MDKPLFTVEGDTLTFDCTDELPQEDAHTEEEIIDNIVELFQD